MSEYGVVRRHRGDGSAGFANKTADPIKNLRYIYIEGSYPAVPGDIVNSDGVVDPTADACTLNFAGQYGGPLQWLPTVADSLGLRQFPSFVVDATEWGMYWNNPQVP